MKDVLAEPEDEYPFGWEVSHYCAIEGEFDPYTPSHRTARSIGEAEQALDNYLKRFENYTQIRANEYY